MTCLQFRLTLLSNIICSVICCLTDCSSQAHISCFVAQYKTELECSTLGKLDTKDFPGLPEDVQVYSRGAIGLDLRWKSPMKGREYVLGYSINFWKYKNILHDGHTFHYNKCIIYNMTQAMDQTQQKEFSNDCLERSGVIHLAALPQADPKKDYVERIITVYNVTSPTDRTNWTPRLITVHNDSCNGRIEVEFDFAPEYLRLPGYRIAVRKAASNIIPDVTNKKHTDKTRPVVFENIEDGHYQILIVPLSCQDCQAIYSAAFVMHGNHPKCAREDETTRGLEYLVKISTPIPQNISVVYITIAAISISCIFIVLVIIIVVARLPRWQKKEKRGISQNNIMNGNANKENSLQYAGTFNGDSVSEYQYPDDKASSYQSPDPSCVYENYHKSPSRIIKEGNMSDANKSYGSHYNAPKSLSSYEEDNTTAIIEQVNREQSLIVENGQSDPSKGKSQHVDGMYV